MAWYAFVETHYEPPPLAANWHSDAYSTSHSNVSHAVLAKWAKGAIQWSRENCEAALKKEGRVFEKDKWRVGNPKNTDKKPPADTPKYPKSPSAFQSADELVQGDDEEELTVEDGEAGEPVSLEE